MTSSSHILPDERELLSLVAEGDEIAFTSIYYHYSPGIYSYVFNKTKSAIIAEEVVQDVFMKLWTMKERISEIDNFASYIFAITANKTYDHLKKISSDAEHLKILWKGMQELSTESSVEEIFDFKVSHEMMNKAIEQLPPERKKIYILNKVEGMSYQEIAERLQISRNTVSNQLVKASKFIRNYLRANGPVTALSAILIKILG